MAWLGKVSLGGFPDIAGAVNKLSESVKNIEKNFDSALGLEEKPQSGNDGGEASGIWPSASDRKAIFSPVMAFMGRSGGADSDELPENAGSPESSSSEREAQAIMLPSAPQNVLSPDENEPSDAEVEDSGSGELQSTLSAVEVEVLEDKAEGKMHAESISSTDRNLKIKDTLQLTEQKEVVEPETSRESSLKSSTLATSHCLEPIENSLLSGTEFHPVNNSQGSQERQETEVEKDAEKAASEHDRVQDDSRQVLLENVTLYSSSSGIPNELYDERLSDSLTTIKTPVKSYEMDNVNDESDSSMSVAEAYSQAKHIDFDTKELSLDPGTHAAKMLDDVTEFKMVKSEMKMMEAALQGAARQAQAKADEIAKLMNENELLKSTIEDLKKKSAEAENDALREEYHQRVSSLERKVYALTKERDTLRREQNKKSDVALLLKEKDEIISQVMAEGENLSKKQAVQEGTIRKLRAQIREFEEEKQMLNSKLQVEESKVESIKRDKAATEKLLQETIEKNQAELVAQKEFYTNALNAAKEAQALAEARVNNEAKVEYEILLREASEREGMLVQTLEELRQTLSRTERQAVFKEDMLQKDIDDLQKRYQASELRYNELISQVPESTRPLLRQIEAMQEAAARKAEAWVGVEANLNARLEAAEAKAASSEEKERLMSDRLSQTLSRMTVLETQVACLRTEQTQLTRLLEKERQRASESRQEYLAAMEEVATHEGRTRQLEDELRELRAKHKQDLQEALVHKELLEKEIERERATRLELERNSRLETSILDQDQFTKNTSRYSENGNMLARKLSSAESVSSMEESYFLQASLDPSDGAFSDRRNSGEISHYFLKSMTPSAFEAVLRQKDGELSSYISRLASLESIRDSLAEELVKMTEQCELLRAEATLLPGVRAELEALRRRHSSALELMGERDEELEELRADIIDLKEMYREQVDLLVNKIQTTTSSVDSNA